MQLLDKTRRVTALMTAESIIVGFSIAYASLINERVVHLRDFGKPVFTTVLAGLLVYGLVLTAFRSLLLFYKSIRTDDPFERNYNSGYDLFLMTILGSGLFALMNAASIVHYAKTKCYVSPPDELLFTGIATLLFGSWVLLVLLTPPKTIGRIRYVRINLGNWLWRIAFVLVAADVAFAISIGSQERDCLLVSPLLKWPWYLLLIAYAVLTIVTIWMLMMPDDAPMQSDCGCPVRGLPWRVV